MTVSSPHVEPTSKSAQGGERHKPAARPQLAALTGIRFFAALYVVIYHIAILYHIATLKTTGEWPAFEQWCAAGNALFDQSWWARGLSRCGFIAVSLFFVLSGFILTYTSLDQQGRVAVNQREFWAARFARIYPVYLFGLLINIPVFLGTSESSGVERMAIAAANLTLLQAWWPAAAAAWNAPGWSLSAEAFFYFMFPFIVWKLERLGRRQLWYVMLGAWLLAFVAPLIYLAVNPDGLDSVSWVSEGSWFKVVKFNPLVRLPEFVFGMALGLLYGPLAEQFARRGESTRGWWSLLAVGLMIVVLAVSQYLPFLLVHNALLLPLFGLLICDLALGGGPLGWLLSRRPLVLLGDASYALYILHIGIISYGLIWMWLVLGGAEHLEREAALKKAQAAATESTQQPQTAVPDDAGQLPVISPAPTATAGSVKDGKVLGPLGFVVVCSTVCVLFSIVVHKLIELPCRRYLRRKLNKTQHLSVPPIVHSDLP